MCWESMSQIRSYASPVRRLLRECSCLLRQTALWNSFNCLMTKERKMWGNERNEWRRQWVVRGVKRSWRCVRGNEEAPLEDETMPGEPWDHTPPSPTEKPHPPGSHTPTGSRGAIHQKTTFSEVFPEMREREVCLTSTIHHISFERTARFISSSFFLRSSKWFVHFHMRLWENHIFLLVVNILITI